MTSKKDLIKLGIKEDKIPKILYKYREFGRFTDDIILNSQFYFSSPNNFNDPFDCNLSFKQDYSSKEIKTCKVNYLKEYSDKKLEDLNYSWGNTSQSLYSAFKKIKDEWISNSGILSLSKTKESITMWSHYSSSHEGLVFELDIEKDYEFFFFPGIVKYIKEYKELSYTTDMKGELKKVFLNKYIDWEYEEEIRIIDFKKIGTKKFNKSALKTIYFGFKASEINIKKIIQLCQLNGFKHTEFKKAKLIHGKFELDFEDIDKKQYLG